MCAWGASFSCVWAVLDCWGCASAVLWLDILLGCKWLRGETEVMVFLSIHPVMFCLRVGFNGMCTMGLYYS